MIELLVITNVMLVIITATIFINLHNEYYNRQVSIPLIHFFTILLIYPVRTIIICSFGNLYIAPGVDLDYENLFYSSLYGMMSLVAYFCGFILSLKKEVKPINYQYLKKIVDKVYSDKAILIIALYFICIIDALLGDEFTQLGDASVVLTNKYYVLLLSIIGFKNILFAIAVFMFYKKDIGKLVFFPILLIYALPIVTSGSKSPLIFLFMILILVYGANKKIKISLVLLSVILLFIATVISHSTRYYIHYKDYFSFTTYLNELLDIIFDKEIISGAFYVLSTRFHGIDSIYNFNNYTNREDFLFGSTFQNFISGLIPRFFWPEKPDTAMNFWFGENVFLVQNTGVAFWTPGEFYMNFGFIGFILVFIYAYVISLVDKKLFSSVDGSAIYLIVYYLFFNSFKVMEYTIAYTTIGMMINFFVTFTFLFLFYFVCLINVFRIRR